MVRKITPQPYSEDANNLEEYRNWAQFSWTKSIIFDKIGTIDGGNVAPSVQLLGRVVLA